VPRKIRIKGATIHLNQSDPVVSGALSLGLYERDEIGFFLKSFKEGMNLVDVGANVGLYTGLALHKSPESQILCIEPDKESCTYLKKTIRSNTFRQRNCNVTVFEVAASDSKEKVFLHKNSGNRGDNRIYPDPLCSAYEEIDSDTLDNLCKQAGISTINYLKVDVQGAEHKVLSGGKQIIAQSANCIVMTEFWPYGLKQCGSAPEEYLALLRELGFKLYELSGHRLTAINDLEHLISRCPGRVYRNLIGVKGRFEHLRA
jgi:FkbM family methyltransferase